MYYNKKLVAILAALSTWSLVPSGRDTMTCSNVVAGTNQNVKNQDTNCTSGASEGGSLGEVLGINAFKDNVSWTIDPDAGKQNLGTIKTKQDFTVQYPGVGKMKIISFIPTAGNSTGKKIEILLVSFSIHGKNKNKLLPDAGTSARTNLDKQLMILKEDESVKFQNLIKVYRKINKTQWQERAELYTIENPDSEKMKFTWTIMPNGMLQADEKLYRTDADGVQTEYDASAIDLTAID